MAAKAQLKTTGDALIQWSSGANFNGYVLCIMAPPALGAGNYPQVSLSGEYPKVRVPTRIAVPIKDGVYNSESRLRRTDFLEPPNVKYCSFFFDINDAQIATGTSLFTAVADEKILDPPALTVPAAAVACVQPEDGESGQVINLLGVPTREDVAGTKNGSNTAFTVSSDPGSLGLVILYLNGTLLDEGLAYTRLGTAVTMISPFIPESTDSFEALIWSA